MRIPLNHDSTTPLYKQIQQYFQDQIRCGGLATDTRLPASRDLATSLGVSRLTVSNAYDELEALGYIYSVRGSGTFVAAVPTRSGGTSGDYPDGNWASWQSELESSTWDSASLMLDRLIDSVAGSGIISFAQGSGDSSLFPLVDFRTALQTVLRTNGKEALGYGDSRGYAPLRATIAQILTGQGIPVNPEQILITSGSQQALDLTTRLLLHPGDTVLTESPTHMGFLDLCRSLNIQLIEAPMDEQGIQVDRVAELLRHVHPRLIYTVPNFQNPTGAYLSATRRRQLVALCEEHQVPLLEDDFVGDLRYRGTAQPALKAFDHIGTVIYTGTFSKMLIPSLRTGYIVATGPIYDRLVTLKHTTDLTTSNLIQRALNEYITVGRYQACLRRARRIFGRRREAMLAALTRHMPVGTRWSNPQGGMFIWLQLPDGILANDLFPGAAQAGILFAPGSFFFPGNRPCPFLRLNFACQPLDMIEEGIRRLGNVLNGYVH